MDVALALKSLISDLNDNFNNLIIASGLDLIDMFRATQRIDGFYRFGNLLRKIHHKSASPPSKQNVSSSCHVEVSDTDTVRHVRLTNSRRGNVLSLEVIRRLQSCVDQISESTRCMVLSANGHVFSAGHDLKELTSQYGEQHHVDVFEACCQLMLSMQKSPVTMIAQVDGVVAAAGLQLVASCDIVLATADSTFSAPGSKVGLFCSTPGIALARAVPRLVCAQMLLTGEAISGLRALQAGLVSELVEGGQMEERTRQIIRSIETKSRSVQALGKRFFYRQLQIADIETAYRHGCDVMVDNLHLQDAQQGIECFLNKRRPQWTNTFSRVNDRTNDGDGKKEDSTTK